MSDILLRKRLGRGSKDDRLDAIESELRRIRKALERKGDVLGTASAKLATTGAGAVIMRVEEVCAVLNISRQTVNNMKDLQPRFGRGRYHPDDVRAYMAHLEAAS